MVIRKPPCSNKPSCHRRQHADRQATSSTTRSHARRGQTGHGHRIPRVFHHRRIDVGRQKFQVPGRRVARCYRLTARRQPIEVPSHGGGKVGRKTTTRLAAPHIAPTLLSCSMPSKSLADLFILSAPARIRSETEMLLPFNLCANE